MKITHLPLTALALCLPLAAQGQTPMSPSEFEAFSENRTLIWALDGADYGVERYAPGRRVIWQDASGECLSGVWEARGPQVCFVYDYKPDEPVCWRFFRQDGGVGANLVTKDAPLQLSVISEEGALICADYSS